MEIDNSIIISKFKIKPKDFSIILSNKKPKDPNEACSVTLITLQSVLSHALGTNLAACLISIISVAAVVCFGGSACG